ncbi:MAG: heme-binding protein [Chloroflexi bacterium]|nr:heme-binding protein [Chloroflexota bacterium]
MSEGRLSFAHAQQVIAAAAARAREIGVPMSICLVDTGGQLVACARMDGAPWATVRIAQAVAETTAAYRLPGLALKPFANELWVTSLRVAGGMPPIPAEGGIPIFLDGEFCGALGVSGGSGTQDRECAVAGLAAIGAQSA